MPRHRDRKSASGLLPRMEATPLKKGGASYRFHPVNGKPIPLGRDKAEAIRKVLDLTSRSPDQGTVGQLWRTYKASPDFTRLAPGTQKLYADCWKMLSKVWEGAVVTAIRPSDVARYLRIERAEAPVVANREVAVLSNLMNLAVETGQIDRNPCKEVRRNKEHARTRLVEAAELEKFVAWALQQGPSAAVLVSMAQFSALAGSRRAEFLNLHWPQVDDMVIRLVRSKQHGKQVKRELIGVSEALQVVLARMKAAPGYHPLGAVFRAPRSGNPYTEPGFKAMWNKLMAKALSSKAVDERFTFHDLRAHYTTYYRMKYGVLPSLHAIQATTEAIYERAKTADRQAL